MAENAPSDPLKIFVTLPVKPSEFDRYLGLTLPELHGARSEEGNSAFFAYCNEEQAGTLHLFEFWNSSEWLTETHAGKPYYKAMRGVEAEVLDGDVNERFLIEVDPVMPLPIGGEPVGYARATVISGAGDDVVDCFAQSASALRKSDGNQGLWLFSVENSDDEYLMLEHWSDAGLRAEAANGENGRLLQMAGQTMLLKDVLKS